MIAFRSFLTAVGLLLGIANAAALPGTALAAGPIDASVTGIENKFPDELVFSIEAASTAADIRSVTLHSIIGSGPAERRGNVGVQPGRNVKTTFSYKTGGNNFVAPGADIAYWLEAQDAAGNKFESDKAVFWYADTRFEWRNLKEGSVTVYYYGAAEANARRALAAAHQTQQKVGNMFGVSARPFRVMLYNTPRDITGAQPVEQSQTRRTEIIRAGIAYSGEDLVQVLGVGGSGAEDTARHEITHLFVHWTAGSNVATWLNEGMAVWGQSDGGQEYVPYFRRALANNALLLIRGMDSFPGKSDDTLLAYGQSYTIVKWMIETYGPEKMRGLMESLKAGDGLARGLQQHYGVTVDQLDAKWRQSVGAPPRSYDTAVPTAIAIPTIAPIGAAPAAPQPTSAGSSAGGASIAGGVPPFLMVGAGVGAFLLVLVGGAAAFSIARRR